MMQAIITGPWVKASAGNHAAIGDDHDIAYCQDLGSLSSSEIVPDPNTNQFVIRCTAEVLTAIEADPKYEVISSEEITEGEV